MLKWCLCIFTVIILVIQMHVENRVGMAYTVIVFNVKVKRISDYITIEGTYTVCSDSSSSLKTLESVDLMYFTHYTGISIVYNKTEIKFLIKQLMAETMGGRKNRFITSKEVWVKAE